jgi:large subunit ribosomal protein L7/L12
VELTKILKETHGIEPAAGGGGVAMAVQAAPAEKAAEKTEFTVSLDDAGAQKIQVIKVIREITGLGLKEAKDLVDGAPKPVKENIAKDQAEDYQKKLEAAGAKVSLK